MKCTKDSQNRKNPKILINNLYSIFSLQRSSGQTGRNNYREPSDEDDDDLVPKRHHRQRHRMNLNRHYNEEEEDNDNDNDNGNNPGVSSRGRIRRPNPRLLD